MPIIQTDDVTGTGGGVKAVIIGLACVFVDKASSHMTLPHGQDPPPGQWNVYVRLTDTCVGLAGGEGPILKPSGWWSRSPSCAVHHVSRRVPERERGGRLAAPLASVPRRRVPSRSPVLSR